MPAVFGGGLGGIGRFARATAANPLWLTALLADLGGVGLQVNRRLQPRTRWPSTG